MAPVVPGGLPPVGPAGLPPSVPVLLPGRLLLEPSLRVGPEEVLSEEPPVGLAPVTPEGLPPVGPERLPPSVPVVLPGMLLEPSGCVAPEVPVEPLYPPV